MRVEDAGRAPARIFTSWGTALYVAADGALRHGDAEAAPPNAFLVQAGPASREEVVELVRRTPDGDLPIALAEPGSAALRRVPLERGFFGLRQGAHFLCAEPDGRITASRATCSRWEFFVASEMWCSGPAAGSAHGRPADCDWRAVQTHLVDPRLRRRTGLRANRPRILIYGYPQWSHGRVYYDVMQRLWRAGFVIDLINWRQDHAASFPELLDYYDLFLTAPDGVRTLADAYGVPAARMIVVSHHEADIRMLVEQKGREIFDEFAAFGAVSDFVYGASMMQGVRRPPTVVPLGIDFESFYAPLPSRLEAVGYASSMSVVTYGVEWKRGHLAEAAARKAGLPFKVAGSTASQTSFHDMPQFYPTVDAVLTSSISEAAQLPVMEAAAAGRLVIGTPVGHFPLRAYQGGGIIAPMEADKFVAFVSEALAHYRDNPSAFRETCSRIQDAARQFDWSEMIGEWAGLIESAA